MIIQEKRLKARSRQASVSLGMLFSWRSVERFAGLNPCYTLPARMWPELLSFLPGQPLETR